MAGGTVTVVLPAGPASGILPESRRHSSAVMVEQTWDRNQQERGNRRLIAWPGRVPLNRRPRTKSVSGRPPMGKSVARDRGTGTFCRASGSSAAEWEPRKTDRLDSFPWGKGKRQAAEPRTCQRRGPMPDNNIAGRSSKKAYYLGDVDARPTSQRPVVHRRIKGPDPARRQGKGSGGRLAQAEIAGQQMRSRGEQRRGPLAKDRSAIPRAVLAEKEISAVPAHRHWRPEPGQGLAGDVAKRVNPANASRNTALARHRRRD